VVGLNHDTVHGIEPVVPEIRTTNTFAGICQHPSSH
jgi:hypothetical protein